MAWIFADLFWITPFPFGLAPSIPPTAVGGCLRSSLQAAATLFNPPNGSWGMVKVRPSRPLEQSHLAARRLDFNHPPTAVGGIEERSSKIWSLLFMLTPHIPQVLKLKLNLTITFQNRNGQSRDQ